MSYNINTKDKCLKVVVSTNTGFYISYWQRPNGTIYTQFDPINIVPGLSVYDWQLNYSGDKEIITTNYYGTPITYNKNPYYLHKSKSEPQLTCSLDVKSIVGNGIIIDTITNQSSNENVDVDGKNIGNYIPTIYHPSTEGNHIVTLRAYSSNGSCSRSATVLTHRLNLKPGEMVSYGVTDYTGYEGFSRLPFTSFKDFVPIADGKDIYSLAYKKDIDNGGADDQLVYQKYNLDTGSQIEISSYSIPNSSYSSSGYVCECNGHKFYFLGQQIFRVGSDGSISPGQNNFLIDITDLSMYSYSAYNGTQVVSDAGGTLSSEKGIYTARDENYIYLLTIEGLIKIDKKTNTFYSPSTLGLPSEFFQSSNYYIYYSPYGVVDGNFIYILDTQTNQYVYKIHKDTGETQKFNLPEPYATVNNTTWFYVYKGVLFYLTGDYILPYTTHLIYPTTSARFKFLDVKDMTLKKEYRLDLANGEKWYLYGVAKDDNELIIDFFKGYVPE